MGANASTVEGQEGQGSIPSMLGCCESRTKVPAMRNHRIARLCGVGMGLDSQLLATGRGAVVTCLAKGGPAEAEGAVQIGDSLVSVDDLDVQSLMSNPDASKLDLTRGVSTILANALLGETNSMVRLGLLRAGEETVTYHDLRRAPLNPGCQWISAASGD